MNALDLDFHDYRISDDIGRVDFEKVTKWLAGAYWSLGISQAEVERGARYSSLVVGAYAGDRIVGYARVASDKTRFGFIMDVFVDEDHRRRGIAGEMVRFAMGHPDHRPIYMWLLATHDAHKVYEGLGFRPLAHPERMMAIQKGRPKAQS